MARFIMLYKGAATDMSDMTPDQQKEVMDKWNAWIGRIGPALADIGNPFGPGVSVVDDGTTGKPAALNGFSVVEAGDLKAAQALADGHPFLSEGKGKFSVEIYELMPVPM